MTSPIIPSDGQTPFDAIRHTRADGSEYWIARELQVFMGYAEWRNFVRAIKQAMIAARAVGASVESNFVGVDRNAGQVGRTGTDYELSRYACYLTAMRGDSDKPEIAAALTYFAVKARQAELADAARFAIPGSFASALELAARQARELEAMRSEVADLEATNAKLSPKARIAEQYEGNPGINPTEFHKSWFPKVRHSDFFEHLYQHDYLIDQRNTIWDKRKSVWKAGQQHMWPTAKGKRYFYLRPDIDVRGVRRQQTLVIPGDAEHDLVAALERDGLPSINRPAIPGADVLHLPRQMRGDAS